LHLWFEANGKRLNLIMADADTVPEVEAEEEEMTWNDLTVPQLKEELTVRGLETTGKKADLIARLEKYDGGKDCWILMIPELL
jgi:hypothetical protein